MIWICILYSCTQIKRLIYVEWSQIKWLLFLCPPGTTVKNTLNHAAVSRVKMVENDRLMIDDRFRGYYDMMTSPWWQIDDNSSVSPILTLSLKSSQEVRVTLIISPIPSFHVIFVIRPFFAPFKCDLKPASELFVYTWSNDEMIITVA